MIYIIIVIGIILDYITKILALNHLTQRDIPIIEGFFDLAYLENRGAAFGIFQGRVILLAVVTSIVLSMLFIIYLKTKNKTPLLTVSTGLILAGGIGNLIDRVRYGFVVDFLSFHWRDSYYFPTFNVADICVTIGTGLLIIYILKEVD